jgi:hypothetical protein
MWQDQSQGSGEQGGSKAGRVRREEYWNDVVEGDEENTMGVRGVAGVWGGERDWYSGSDLSSRKAGLLFSSIILKVWEGARTVPRSLLDDMCCMIIAL